MISCDTTRTGGTTYFVSDERMLKHRNEWDNQHIETPERLSCILDILRKENVLESCIQLEARSAALDDIRLVHSDKLISEIAATQAMDKEMAENFSATKEDIYVNKHSYEAALLAAGSAVHLLETVLKNPGSNGFAAIRPPGHHASKDAPCGFCIFNNIAICAKKARQMGVDRVLIFDWDVHAAQGTQYCIEGDPGIKLISIHRFENGTFWPELAESAVRQPYKNTINVPLNEIGYGDAEYVAILNYLVLPIIMDWKPQLILVSCGYDAATGDPQGDMDVSPGGYSYMTGTLASLGIPLVLLLEGGYFMHSVAKSALYTMNALIQSNQLKLNLRLSSPSIKFMAFLDFFIANYSQQYNIFGIWHSICRSYKEKKQLPKVETIIDDFKGKKELNFPYPTRGLYKPVTEANAKKFDDVIASHIAYYKTPIPQKEKLYVSYEAKNGEFKVDDISISVKNDAEYNAIFFYVLIPLSFVREIKFSHSLEGKQTIYNGLYRVVKYDGHTSTINISRDEFSKKFKQLLDTFEFVRSYFGL